MPFHFPAMESRFLCPRVKWERWCGASLFMKILANQGAEKTKEI